MEKTIRILGIQKDIRFFGEKISAACAILAAGRQPCAIPHRKINY